MPGKLVKSLAVAAAVAGISVAVPATAAHAASGCTTLYAGGGGTASVCKSWNDPDGDGLYYGTLSVNSASSRVYVQASQDGLVYNLTGRGGTGSGSYTDVRKLLLRACNTSCSGWW
nr:hypothetical protein GCM10020063_029590 [Dactylosporangium thailandense]